MDNALKNFFNADLVERLARSIHRVYKEFETKRFIKLASLGLERLELLRRSAHICDAMYVSLPTDYLAAADILEKSLGPELEATEGHGMSVFFYLPHVQFVAKHGLDHFERSMQLQKELTKRFSAEFSLRHFVQRYPEESMAVLHQWCEDENVHVRRLVSEGTRPRLPWASRLSVFADDPTPTLELLEKLRDDPELYVRRSVANHLNDIGKTHPDLLVQTCKQWQKNSTKERDWVIRHALRSLSKKGHSKALALQGIKSTDSVQAHMSLGAKKVKIGDSLRVDVTVKNQDPQPLKARVDLKVHYVKANGQTSAKVFHLGEITLATLQPVNLSKSISFRQMTTRTHYPGNHTIETIVNGHNVASAAVEVIV